MNRTPHPLILTLIAVVAGCSTTNSTTNGGPTAADAAVVDSAVNSSALRVFRSAKPYAVDGGVAGADLHCGSDSANPGSGEFKALLGGAARKPCSSANCTGGVAAVDWVLAPNTQYYRVDGTTKLFLTDANAIVTAWPMDNPLTDGGINQLSGFSKDWTLRAGMTCGDWTVTDTGRAAVGWTAATDSGFLDGGDLPCGPHIIVCVEQP